MITRSLPKILPILDIHLNGGLLAKFGSFYYLLLYYEVLLFGLVEALL